MRSTVGSAPISYGGTLTAFQQGDFAQLDPQRVSAASEIGVARILFRTLTALCPSQAGHQLVPDLATDTGRPSGDFSRWMYTLRPGLIFEDGSKLTAADVRFGIERSFDPDVSGGGDLHKSWLDGSEAYSGPGSGHLASIEVLSPDTLVFHLRRACPDWPYIVAQPATAAISQSGASTSARSSVPLASGPYRVSSWRPGMKMSLDRNPFWDRATDLVRIAGPDRIVFEFAVPGDIIDRRLLDDDGPDRNAIMLGSALEPETLESLANSNGMARVTRSATGCMRFLAVNTLRIPDVRVRQALWAATDVEEFKRARGLVASQTVLRIVPPSISGLSPEPGPRGRAGLGAVASLLRASGHEVLHLRIAVPDTPSNRAGFDALASGYERSGITADLHYIPNAEYISHADRHRDDYDVMLHGWCALYPDPSAVIPPLFRSSAAGPGGANLSRYVNQEVDNRIDSIPATGDAALRTQMWNDLDDRIMKDVPIIPMLVSTAMALHGSAVRNCVIHPGFGQLDLAGLYLSGEESHA